MPEKSRQSRPAMGPRGHRFIAIVTGPWEGRGTWLFKVKCECGYEELADTRDEAYDTKNYHRDNSEPVLEWEEEGY